MKKTKPAVQPEPLAPTFDLLSDPLLGVRTASDRRLVTLPEVLAMLGKSEVESFTGLQSHQRHAWHAFLVQLAAIALERAGEARPVQSAKRWKELLLELTPKAPQAWQLIVADLTRPAFLQPQVPEKSLEPFQRVFRTPDDLDVLVTSKNHDVKSGRVGRARPEHWVYALVSLQTMEGFSGRNNYGIARMNGGFGSRPGVGLAPGLDAGARFRRDVGQLLRRRSEVVRLLNCKQRGGKALLWLAPWDGTDSIALKDLDPWFIEVCRRVRLVAEDGAVRARFASTISARVAGAALNGNTGDPWSPVQLKEGKVFTATETGFSYRVAAKLMLRDGVKPGAAQVRERGEKCMLFTATVLARGQGKTAGFHERRIPLRDEPTLDVENESVRQALARLAQERIQAVSTVQNAVLKPALLTLLQGAPDRLDFKDDRAERWLAALDARVDAQFFVWLWNDAGQPEPELHRKWVKWLLELARAQFHDASRDAPSAAARRLKAIVCGERVLEGAARKKFPEVFEKEVANG